MKIVRRSRLRTWGDRFGIVPSYESGGTLNHICARISHQQQGSAKRSNNPRGINHNFCEADRHLNDYEDQSIDESSRSASEACHQEGTMRRALRASLVAKWELELDDVSFHDLEVVRLGAGGADLPRHAAMSQWRRTAGAVIKHL